MKSTTLVFFSQRPVAPLRMAPKSGRKGMSQSTGLWSGVLRAAVFHDHAFTWFVSRRGDGHRLGPAQPLRRLIWSTWMVSFLR